MKRKIPPKRNGKKVPGKNSPLSSNLWLWLGIIFAILIFMSQSSDLKSTNTPKDLSYSEFYTLLKNNPETSQITSIEMTENQIEGTMSDGSKFKVIIPEKDETILQYGRYGKRFVLHQQGGLSHGVNARNTTSGIRTIF